MEWLRESFEPERKTPVNPMKQALAMSQLLETPEIRSKADIAKRLGISRARVTQTLNILRLDPKIQNVLLDLPEEQSQVFTERRLRPITQILDPKRQLQAFQLLRSAMVD